MAIQAVFKCVLCCSQTSLVVQDLCKRRECVCVCLRGITIIFWMTQIYCIYPLPVFLLFLSDFSHLSPLFPHSCRFLSCRPSPPRGEGYSVLLFEVDICIIRLGCGIVSGLPPSEGAPEERGRCPAQQWRTPLLSHPSNRPAPAPDPPDPGFFAFGLAAKERQGTERGGSGRAGEGEWG